MYTGAPYSAVYINAEASQNSPGTIHSQDTITVEYYRRYLLQLAMSVFRWTLPKTWSKPYFLYSLYTHGYLAIINTDRYGVIPQACGLYGYNIFYQPTHALIVNPKLSGIMQPEIDSQCTLLRMQPDYGGLMDIVNDYAERLALASQVSSINLVNSKMSYVFTASTKAGAESLKKLYDEVTAGNPAVVQHKKLLGRDGDLAWQPFFQNVKQSYIAGELQDYMARTISEFCCKVGIPSNPYGPKKERQVVDEIHANDTETQSLPSTWLESLQEGVERAKEMFPGLDLAVDWRFKPTATREEVDSNESNTKHPGTV